MGPTRSRSRRLRRSPPSTWPGSGRPSRSLRSLRTVLGWLRLPFSTKITTLPTRPRLRTDHVVRLVYGHFGPYFASTSLAPFLPLAYKKKKKLFKNYSFIVIEPFDYSSVM